MNPLATKETNQGAASWDVAGEHFPEARFPGAGNEGDEGEALG